MEKSWTRKTTFLLLAALIAAAMAIPTVIVVTLLRSSTQLPVVQLAPDSPMVLRSGEQVPLMKFKVTAPDADLTLKTIYFNFGFFYDCDSASGAVSAENFTLWNGPDKISQGERLGSHLVLFSPYVVVPSHRSIALTLRSDVAGADATMKMILVVLDNDNELRAFRLNQSLEILRP